MAGHEGREIETERLVMRPPAGADLSDWARKIFADPDVMRYGRQRDMAPRERAERALAEYRRLWRDHEACGWVVFDKTTGEFIGHCEIQKELGEPELGFALGKQHWGQGIATEVARAATRFGFEVANLDRIRAVVDPDNIASWKVLTKIGFEVEENAVRNDIEVAFYSIRREAFEPGDSFYKVSPPATET